MINLNLLVPCLCGGDFERGLVVFENAGNSEPIPVDLSHPDGVRMACNSCDLEIVFPPIDEVTEPYQA